eukprot:g1509.t1
MSDTSAMSAEPDLNLAKEVRGYLKAEPHADTCEVREYLELQLDRTLATSEVETLRQEMEGAVQRANKQWAGVMEGSPRRTLRHSSMPQTTGLITPAGSPMPHASAASPSPRRSVRFVDAARVPVSASRPPRSVHASRGSGERVVRSAPRRAVRFASASPRGAPGAAGESASDGGAGRNLEEVHFIDKNSPAAFHLSRRYDGTTTGTARGSDTLALTTCSELDIDADVIVDGPCAGASDAASAHAVAVAVAVAEQAQPRPQPHAQPQPHAAKQHGHGVPSPMLSDVAF